MGSGEGICVAPFGRGDLEGLEEGELVGVDVGALEGANGDWIGDVVGFLVGARVGRSTGVVHTSIPHLADSRMPNMG